MIQYSEGGIGIAGCEVETTDVFGDVYDAMCPFFVVARSLFMHTSFCLRHTTL